MKKYCELNVFFEFSSMNWKLYKMFRSKIGIFLKIPFMLDLYEAVFVIILSCPSTPINK